MKTQEIENKNWQEFCGEFTEANRGSLLAVEIIGADGIRSEVVRDVPLDKMTLDTTDACNNIISFSFGQRGQRKINHFVIEPIHLRIRQGETGNKFLEIGSENGITLVAFHSGRFPQRQSFKEDKQLAGPS